MILTNKMCYSVSKELANAIREISGVNLLVSTKQERTRQKFVHIRYGGTTESLSNEPVFNSVDFIKLCANKKAFSDLLVENDIRTVTFYPKREYQYQMGVVLVREDLYSFGGRGITVCRNIEEVQSASGDWISPFIRFSDEYRVHIFNGKIIRIQKKLAGINEEEEYPIRNHSRGYFFSTRSTLDRGMENFPALSTFVQKIVELLPEKHFCGLDLGKAGRNFYVIENNSSIGLEASTLYLYASKFCEEFGWKIRVNLDDYILPTTEEGVTNVHRTGESSQGASAN